MVRTLRPAPRADLVSGFGAGLSVPTRFRPTETLGVPGFAIWNGYIQNVESDADLQGQTKFQTYSDLLANVSVIGGSARYFTNLVAKQAVKFEPADESPRARELAELTEMIMDEMQRPLRNVRRRAALFTLYGFSAHEWIAERRADGLMGIHRIDPRVQKSITQWPVDETGQLLGVIQESPQDFTTHAIPRNKLLYLVDDAFHDSPEGLGVFRHIVQAGDRLRRYEQIEGMGYETDLRGVPIARIPSAANRATGADPDVVAAQEAPIKDIAKNHFKGSSPRGLVLDSAPYANVDGSPSSVRRWDFEILKGDGQGLPEVHQAIQRIAREIAIVFGTQQLFLGTGSTGTQALSQDQSTSLGMVVDQTNDAIADGFRCDIFGPLFDMNGWPQELRPFMRPDRAQTRDIESVTRALSELARSGITLNREDEVVQEVFTTLGYTPPSPIELDEDDVLPTPQQASENGDADEMASDADEIEDTTEMDSQNDG